MRVNARGLVALALVACGPDARPPTTDTTPKPVGPAVVEEEVPEAPEEVLATFAPPAPCTPDPTLVDRARQLREQGKLQEALEAARQADACPSAASSWERGLVADELWRDAEARDAYQAFQQLADEARRGDADARLAALDARTDPRRSYSDAELAESERLREDALDLIVAGETQQARPKLLHAYELVPVPGTLAMLAATYRLDTRPAEAELWNLRALGVAEVSRGVVAEPHIMTGYTGIVAAVAVSPNRKLVAVAGEDGCARLFSAETGIERSLLLCQEGAVGDVAFSPDGALISTGSEAGVLRVWKTGSGAEVAVADWPSGVTAMAFHPTLPLLATGAIDGSLRVWDLSPLNERGGEAAAGAVTLRQQKAFVAHDDRVVALDWSLTRERDALVSAAWDGKVMVTAYATGKREQVLAADKDRVTDAAMSPAGDVVVATGSEQKLRFFRIRDGKLLRTAPVERRVNSLAFSGDGKRLYGGGGVIGEPNRLYTFNARGRQVGAAVAHDDTIDAMASSGDVLVTGGDDSSVYVWARDARRPHRQLTGSAGVNYATALAGDGKSLALSQDARVMIWTLGHAPMLRAIVPGTKEVVGLAWSQDLATLYAVHVDRSVAAYDAATGNRRLELARSAGAKARSWVADVVVSPEGARVAAPLSEAGPIGVFDAATGKLLVELKGHKGEVNALRWLDGARLVSAGDDRFVIVWNVADGSILHKLAGHTAEVVALAVSADGSRIVSGAIGKDHVVRVWDLATGDVTELSGHTDRVRAVAFEEDGQMVLSGSFDRTLRVWDTRTGDGRVIARLPSSVRAITRVSGRFLVMLRSSQVYVVDPASWSITGQLFATFEDGRPTWLATSTAGQVDASKEGREFLRWRIADVLLEAQVLWERRAAAGLVGALTGVR